MNKSTAQPHSHQIHTLMWADIDALTAQLAERIQADTPPDVLIGLQRGGLVLAVALSHRLAIPTLLSLPVRRTLSDAIYAAKHDPVVEANDLFVQITGKDVLVVDDVAGSGATLKAVFSVLCRYAPARLRSAVYVLNQEHWDRTSGEKPTYIGRDLSGWVVFPWEVSPASGVNDKEGETDEWERGSEQGPLSHYQ
jgi:hypoxanthine phosphoribosyltransferase